MTEDSDVGGEPLSTAARLAANTRANTSSMAEHLGANLPSRELVQALDRARHRIPTDTVTAESNLLDGVRLAMLGPPGEPMAGVDAAITRAHTRYQRADYDDAARLLPRIISGLTASPARAKAVAYLAAAKLATKAGDAGLAWVAADRCAAFAVEADEPELVGVARYQVAAALLAGGHDSHAERAAGEALDDLPVGNDVRGSLLDRNHLWTAFGPANLAVHELGVHVALGDTRTAMRLGERIDTNALPAQLKGRRAQIHLELAAAAAGQRADPLAVLHLLEVERVARQAVARNATARRLVGELLARDRGTPGLRALAARAGVAA